MKNRLKKIFTDEKGLSLIEMLVVVLLLSVIMIAMLAVFAGISSSQQNSKSIKASSENLQYAMNYMAKDIRMGKIESYVATGTRQNYIMISRNSGGKVCYRKLGSYKIQTCEVDLAAVNCLTACPTTSPLWADLVDLTGTGMAFSANSGFTFCQTAFDTATQCPAGTPAAKRRGWARINLTTTFPNSGTDYLPLETTVSSRDYGWEEMTP